VGNLWVTFLYNPMIMTEKLTLDSFIVRIYRADMEDQRKITGLVEVMDGSGEREHFASMDELAVILNRSAGRPQKYMKKKAVQVSRLLNTV
jgi:hypothetical protein